MKKTQKPDYDKPTTIIGKDTVLESSVLKSSKAIQINGTYIGDILVDASVSIGETGHVQGNVKAHFLLVAGKVDGNCELSSQIHLTKTARVNGNITCGSIIIDEGAQVDGLCSMTSSTPAVNKQKDKTEEGK